MPRKRNIETAIWNISLEKSLAAEVEELLIDPRYNAPRYGARSHLITQLLKLYVKRKRDELRVEAKAETSNE